MYTVDLHNHTKFSYDGSNTHEEIIENAIRHGVDVIGITDHQFSIGENLPIYYEYIQHCKIKYADQIKVLCGLEIGTRPTPPESLPRATEIFDYVLFECLDDTRAIDFYEFLEWRKLFKCKAGLAHTDIFKLGGNVYAFDSTTIPLCLATFPWAKFRKKKGGVKAHVLYDIEAQVPAFYTVTTASKHDSTAMSTIHYEPNAYYIFDRAYDSFRELYKIHLTESFYVVRAKTNLKYKTIKWKRRMPKNILTDAEVKLTGYLSEKKYPESFRIIGFYDEENEREFTFLTNAKHLSALDVANLYKKVDPKR